MESFKGRGDNNSRDGGSLNSTIRFDVKSLRAAWYFARIDLPRLKSGERRHAWRTTRRVENLLNSSIVEPEMTGCHDIDKLLGEIRRYVDVGQSHLNELSFRDL